MCTYYDYTYTRVPIMDCVVPYVCAYTIDTIYISVPHGILFMSLIVYFIYLSFFVNKIDVFFINYRIYVSYLDELIDKKTSYQIIDIV